MRSWLILLMLLVPGAIGQETRPAMPAGLANIQVEKADGDTRAKLAAALRADDVALLEVRDGFRRAFLRAIREAVKSDKLTRMEGITLRVASFSPAFLERAEEMAVIQIALSGETSPHVPVSDDGSIEREGINWDGLIKFLEALLPLILQLINALG